MAARTWVGRLWRGLAALEEEREEAYVEEHQEGLGFLWLPHSTRGSTSSPCKV